MSVLATASAWLTGLAQDLNPDGSEARQWLADELANDEYRDGRPLLTRIIEWLVDVITDLLSGFRVTGVSFLWILVPKAQYIIFQLGGYHRPIALFPNVRNVGGWLDLR